MNRGLLSNTLRKLGLLYPLDKMRYRVKKNKNEKTNKQFKADNPNVLLPPDYLIYESFQMNYSKYFFGGKDTAQWIFGELEKYKDLKDKNILDWGCGPGRVIRHMPEISKNQSHFYGTDYNKDSIDWCRNNIPSIKFNHNKLEAKLPYEDSSFDAIYGISIFTHLSKEMHLKWFNELQRILKPGGLLLLTTQGENFKSKLSAKENQKFDQGHLIVRGNVKEGHRTYSAFHPDPFLHKLFESTEILDKIVLSPEGKSYIPQDTWIMKKK